jgi:hypothetical protein
MTLGKALRGVSGAMVTGKQLQCVGCDIPILVAFRLSFLLPLAALSGPLLYSIAFDGSG